MQGHAVLRRAVQGHAVLRRAVQGHAVLRRAVLRRAVLTAPPSALKSALKASLVIVRHPYQHKNQWHKPGVLSKMIVWRLSINR